MREGGRDGEEYKREERVKSQKGKIGCIIGESYT